MDHAQARAKLAELGIPHVGHQVSLLHRATLKSVINTTGTHNGLPISIMYNHVIGWDVASGWRFPF